MSVARYTGLLLLALSAQVRASDETKAIAPLVDAETAAVVHVDVSRVSIDAIADFVVQRVPATKPPLAQARQEAARRLEAFRRAGGKDVYVVVSFRTPGPLSGVLLGFALDAGADEKALRRSIGVPETAGRRVGDLLVLGLTPWTVIPERFEPADRPELREAFAAVSGSALQAVLIPPSSARRVIEELVPQLPPQVGGGPSTVLTRGLRWAALGLDLPPRLAARLVVQSPDAQAAAALRARWQTLMQWAGGEPAVRQFVVHPETTAALLVPRVEGDRLVLAFEQNSPIVAETLASVLHALESARAKARQTMSQSNLRQIGVAMYQYEAARKSLPAPASFDRDGKPLLSWRVHLLPYMNQEELYRQFHLDEPWDSPHNRPLVDKMPRVFLSPLSKIGHGTTNYLLPVGDGALYASTKDQPRISDIRDGMSNTIMLLEVDDPQAVVWTRPDDWTFDPQAPKRGLGSLDNGGFEALFCDGATRFLPNTISASQLKSALTRSGGEKPEGD